MMQLTIIFLNILSFASLTLAIKCFTCASAEYEELYERFVVLRHSLRTPHFGELCDSVETLQALAPIENCPTTCISLMEPQYMGGVFSRNNTGVQSLHKPYAYIRGCASTIFSDVVDRAPEVDFLHTESICLPLQLSQLWPSIQTNEHVHVCSCTEDGCNYDIAVINKSKRLLPLEASNLYVFYTILLLVWLF